MSRTRPGTVVGTVAVTVLALLAGVLGGVLLGRGTSDAVPRVDDAVDVGFAHDMKVHHAQAVEMAAVVHRRTTDRELSALAYDILTTQQGQIGIMSGWLDLWRQPQSGRGPTMAWMGHTGDMPGMASREQVAELGTLPVPQMEEQFLRLMIAHHEGAVPMAAYAAEHAKSQDVVRLARGMELGQASEIELMQAMLAQRGLAPAAPPSAHSGHG